MTFAATSETRIFGWFLNPVKVKEFVTGKPVTSLNPESVLNPVESLNFNDWETNFIKMVYNDLSYVEIAHKIGRQSTYHRWMS